MRLSALSARGLCRLLQPLPLAAPKHRDLTERLRTLIIDGQLAHRARLPSERDLAAALGISRTTVASSFATLRERGYLVARQGAGHYVQLPHDRLSSTTLPGPYLDGDVIGLSAASASAPPGLAAAYAAAATQLPGLLGSTGYFPEGLPELREEIADGYRRRGLPTSPEQVVVTSGALAALHIALLCLASPGERVLTESTSYCNALAALRHHHLHPTPVQVSADGWDVESLPQVLRSGGASLGYLIPDFHNPTGALMTEEVRERIGHTLDRAGVTTIVDETLAELDLEQLDGDRYGRLPAPFARWSRRAITLGSASKTYWGGLRIGWLRAPRDLVRPLIETRASLDLASAPYEQLVLTHLLRLGDGMVLDQRRRFRARRDHLAAALGDTLPEWDFDLPTGGLSLWVTLPTESAERFAATSSAHGLCLAPGGRSHVGAGGRRHLRIPFTAEESVLSTAVDRMAETWQSVASGAGRRRAPEVLSA